MATTPSTTRRYTLIAIAVVLLLVGGWIAHDRWFGGGVAGMARSGDPAQRLLVIESLRASDAGWSDRLLRELAADADHRAAVQAIRVLADRPGDTNKRLLLTLAEADDVSVCAEAIASLGGQRGVPIERFTEALRTGASPEIRAGAARALARRNDRAAAGALVDALSDEDQRVRMEAIRAINGLTIWRTDYRAEAPIGTQRKQIAAIRHLLTGRSERAH